MTMKRSAALLAALALIAAPALAQDASTPATTSEQPAEATAADTPTTEAPATEAATPATDASAAAPETPAETPAEPALGSYYAKDQHQDWVIRCIKTDQDKDPCEMYKLLQDGEGTAVAELTLIPLTGGDVAAGATLIAPLGTDLMEGVGMQVDSGQARAYPFGFCEQAGCVARMGFTNAELTQMKRGNQATLRLLPFGGDPQNPVLLPMSLSGFTAAFNQLEEYVK
ncbi:invasion associated locus B family protein [Paracoccus sp. (in: a-proteobacteria)]|uniref:invasion associated locus B family protein n=1 Tax=Paracoccus sp. TaxID=267 RepID=UPI0026DEF293|nr:invasion associated locus B family protein [Paracoccus sp. (in: a-proteobacteria)]MDO5646494.1 invasion associated locus B family protein [Paracoccus sp. (in: a-proteobacteria)]